MAFDIKTLTSFNWRSLQKYFTPQATDDLNRFLEKMPANVSKNSLMMVGIVWSAAALIGLFTTVQVKSLTKMRADLSDMKALQPVVPKIRDVPVSPSDLKGFTETLVQLYPDLVIKGQGAAISISAKSTANFAEFREAIGHVQNGGSGWRVAVDKLCVGRECQHDQLSTLLKISKVSVDKPQ